MKDRVPLYPGRVTLTPVSGQANTFDLVRADQPTQEGTPLNKESLLKDTTASLFGLGTDAVPDDAFNVLSRFQNGLGNEYVWGKNERHFTYSERTLTNYAFFTYIETTNTNRIYASDDIPSPVLRNGSWVFQESDFELIAEFNATNLDSILSNLQTQLRGKYFIGTQDRQNIGYVGSVMFLPEDATLSVGTNAGAGWKFIRASTCKEFGTPVPYYDTIGYVNSPDPNAYPPAVPDGYTYTTSGQLGAKAQIVTGSYIGTGVYLASLTFDFTPKIVIIAGGREDYNVGAFPYIWGDTVLRLQYENYSKQCTVTINGNQMSWINPENNIDFALNYSGITYRYVAIG